MKGRILKAARQVFGEYGFHGTTTRMIAEAVGIDISTLHYHWGDKGDLYEAAVLDITEDLRLKLIEVERVIHGRPLAVRMDMAIDLMTDYLFESPEISNLILFRYFGKTRPQTHFDFHVPEFISDIARSMDLCKNQKNAPVEVRMQVLTLMNAIHSFISGENFFRPMLGLEKEPYRKRVKETLKFILIPAFSGTKRRDEAAA
ncbi:MAG: TetR/AcrR family transcriptional regulator [Deltaproteobacteria bacterium]|nr:TetR/AcrR family transcriptional regulator [Deltaproteobacteria bacterium]MCF8120199.1 TetR/AcrR family transcriptional regulator [Deltaproteobacteria bacterium]